VGELRNGDRPSGKQIHDHLRNAEQALPPIVKRPTAVPIRAFTAGKPSKRLKKWTPGS
jgi:hypothetical protein